MTVRELIDQLEAYGDDVEVRVGWTGDTANMRAAILSDAARVVAVDYTEPGSSTETPAVVIGIGCR